MVAMAHDADAHSSSAIPDEATDPPPRPPAKPLPFDCCESGCERCVFDVYAEELDHYVSAMAAWRERNPHRQPEPG